MAERGAPQGNQNAAKAKRWTEAINRAIAAYPEPVSTDGCNPLMVGLNNAATAFVARMMAESDLGFFKEFGDRIEGKPHQSVDVGNPDGTSLFSGIERVILKNGNS